MDTSIQSHGERVGFGKRFAASILDGIISIVVGAVFGSVAGGYLGTTFATIDETGEPAGLFGAFVGVFAGFFVGIVLVAVLYGLIEAFSGASPAKSMLKIRIFSAEGNKASRSQLFLRYGMKNIAMLSSLLTLVTGVGTFQNVGQFLGLIVLIGFFAVLSKKRQALHDMVAKTAVYSR